MYFILFLTATTAITLVLTSIVFASFFVLISMPASTFADDEQGKTDISTTDDFVLPPPPKEKCVGECLSPPNIENATVTTKGDKILATLKLHGLILKNGKQGAYGYGIVTSKGFNALIVSETHRGAVDSELQKNADDPVWHNHYIVLGKPNPEICGNAPIIDKITFESPGDIKVQKSIINMSNLDASFNGTDVFTDKKLTLKPGTDVKQVVKFFPEPVFNHQDNTIKAVCISGITPADNVNIDTSS